MALATFTILEFTFFLKLTALVYAYKFFGDYYKLIADDNIYAYIWSDLNERVLIVLNKENNNKTAKLVFPSIYKVSKLISLIDNSEIVVDGNEVSVKLSSQNYNIYKIVSLL